MLQQHNLTFLAFPTDPPLSSFVVVSFVRTEGTNVTIDWLGGSPGLVVMGRDSCSKGRGFESQHRMLDGHDIFSHWFVVKICNVCLKRPKINEKRPGSAHFFKKNNWSDECNNSSVDSSAPSILPPRVRVPSTPSMLSSIYIWFMSCRKFKNKEKEAGIGPFKKHLMGSENVCTSVQMSAYSDGVTRILPHGLSNINPFCVRQNIT